MSVSEYLPRLQSKHPTVDVKKPLPALFTVNVSDSELALDSRKFNMIIHDILLNKMVGMEVPTLNVRWMAARVQIGEVMSKPVYPNGDIPQGMLSGPTHFLVYINDLQTSCPIYKYVDSITFGIYYMQHKRGLCYPRFC